MIDMRCKPTRHLAFEKVDQLYYICNTTRVPVVLHLQHKTCTASALLDYFYYICNKIDCVK